MVGRFNSGFPFKKLNLSATRKIFVEFYELTSSLNKFSKVFEAL